jgi:hypothetical protein
MNVNKNASAASPAPDPMSDPRLGAARKRLAESHDEEDAIEGLREIVGNLLGSEEVGLFKADDGTANFQVCWSFGIDLENYDLRAAMGDAGSRRVMDGECHVNFVARDHSHSKAMAQAFVPIRVANQTIGILAILRLLPQKHAFDAFDMELFELLSNEAGKPLFGPRGHSKPVTDEPGMRT